MMIWYAMVWYAMLCYATLCYDMIWCDVMWCDDVMWYDVMWCDVMSVMWCDVMWYGMTWHDMTWHNVHCVFLLGPSVGPVIQEGYNTSETSMYIRWNHSSIPREKWNSDMLTGFKISWYDPGKRITISNDTGSLTDRLSITNARPFTRYRVCVAGRTKSYIGASSSIVITTDEDGRSKMN